MTATRSSTRRPQPPTPAAAQQAKEAAEARRNGVEQPNRRPRTGKHPATVAQENAPRRPAKPATSAAVREVEEAVARRNAKAPVPDGTPGPAKLTAAVNAKPEPKKQPKPKSFDYVFVLRHGDSNFEVHKPGCADIKKTQTDYAQPAAGTATSYAEMVRDLWSDQIAEHEAPDAEKDTDEWVLKHFDVDIDVKPCLRIPGAPKATPAKAVAEKRNAKRELATDLIEAVGKFAATLSDDEKKTIAQWLHHLPADRERWVASGLPKPDRSDWR